MTHVTSFEETLSESDQIDGWLRPEQARVLWDRADAVRPGGTIVEIGSLHGKSTVVLGKASHKDVKIYAIDPHLGNCRAPGDWEVDESAGRQDLLSFTNNIERNELADRVRHVREFSQDAHKFVPGSVDFLYVDGAHDYRSALKDLRGWGDRVTAGGYMGVHDTYGSFFVTLATIRCMWFSRRWRYEGRASSLAVYSRADLSLPELIVNAGRQALSLPWFAKNMVVKLLQAVGLKRLAALGEQPGGGIY